MKPNNEQNHLPIYGPGPFYVGILLATTAAAALLGNTSILAPGRMPGARIPLRAAGILLILLGVSLWIYAVPISKIDEGILENRLVTTGAYAWVRNPIYSAFLILCTGVTLIIGNRYFFILPLFYWLFLTVLMKKTEEKWLKELYGEEYEAYCRRVNRCWPWFPRKEV